MAFKKGESGNPKGRKPGTGKIHKLRQQLESKSSELVNALIEQALTGDVQALKFCVEQILPKQKATLPPVTLPESGGKLANIGEAVIHQTTRGEIAPDVGTAIMTLLQGQIKIVESEELAARLERLEQMMDARK